MLNVIITGATGFVGEGVLLECLKSDKVGKILSVSRRPSGRKHEKLEELIIPNFKDLKENLDYKDTTPVFIVQEKVQMVWKNQNIEI